jgi:hypothetical protein
MADPGIAPAGRSVRADWRGSSSGAPIAAGATISRVVFCALNDRAGDLLALADLGEPPDERWRTRRVMDAGCGRRARKRCNSGDIVRMGFVGGCQSRRLASLSIRTDVES